jgi:3alpha(or 20beta)-hydroxysteroid dehydrogenase
LAETVSAIETEGGTARAFVADVTAPSSVQACVEEAGRLGNGTVGAFFNNAGAEGLVAPIDAYPQDAFDQVIAVNVRSVYLGLKYVAQVMGNGGDIRAALLSGVSLGWPMGGLGSWTGGQ